MSLFRAIAGAFLVVVFASCARAEDRRQGGGMTADPAPTRARVLTGKERLGPKWSDEQRIDNCNVPLDKRGNKPRPSACANAPQS